MNILHVIPSLTLAAGGPPVVAVNIARALQAADVNTSIYATAAFQTNHRDTAVEDPPVGISTLNAKVFPLGRLRRLAYSRELEKALASSIQEFDVVHIHMLFQYPQYIAFKSARRAGVPHVVSPHGALDPFLRDRGKYRKAVVDRIWQRKMMDSASAIHYTTSEERDLVNDLGFQAPPAIIPNGVDVQNFASAPRLTDTEKIRGELNLGEAPLIVNHGRIDRKKGLPILIRAMKIVRLTIPDARLVLVGPDSRGHQRELEELITAEGLQTVVSFAGLRRDRELVTLIHMADVWALPSHTENFGYAVAEAMAAGKSVITSRHVNIAPAAEQAGALTIADNEPKALAHEIVRQLIDRQLRISLGARAHSYALQFDWQVVGQQFLDLYRSIVEESHRRG